MKKNPGRKERRKMYQMAHTKGYGHQSQYAGTHRKKRNQHENSM